LDYQPTTTTQPPPPPTTTTTNKKKKKEERRKKKSSSTFNLQSKTNQKEDEELVIDYEHTLTDTERVVKQKITMTAANNDRNLQVLTKLNKNLDSGNFYEALQLYKLINHRFLMLFSISSMSSCLGL